MRTLVLTFLGLLLLLTMTVWVSTLELGPVTLVISLTISLAKMVLILVFFMHLRSSGALMTCLACAGFIWLALLFALSFDDYAFRPGHADTRAPSVEERPLPPR